MSQTLSRVQALVDRGQVRISAHGYDELAADDIFIGDVIAGVAMAIVVEDYPHFVRGPCVLVLQKVTTAAYSCRLGYSGEWHGARGCGDSVPARSCTMV
jgi:hypothetical protein